MKILDLAIIGVGRAGTFHINSLKKLKGFNLKYIVDSDEILGNICSKENNCEYLNNINTLFENKVDCVIIASSTYTHYDFTKKCLQNNIHVFCENPLGNIEEIRQCFDLSKRNKLKLIIGFQKRFDKNYQKILKIMEQNPNFNLIRTISRDYPVPNVHYLKNCNGIVKDMLSHDIDIVNLIMNNQFPKKIYASHNTKNTILKKENLIENLDVILNYENGVSCIMNCGRTSKFGYDQRFEIHGEFGKILLNNEQKDSIAYENISGNLNSSILESFPDRYKEAYIEELDYFYRAITQNLLDMVTCKQLINIEIICDKINESLETGKEVYIEKLRDFNGNSSQYILYKNMHINQNYDFVMDINKKYNTFTNELDIIEVLKSMDNFIDPSDPDLDVPNSIHAYQTAERIRKKHPLDYELQITGLIHDLGKILFKFNEPNWSIVGDTYAVGCKFPKSIVFYNTLKENSDFNNTKYNTKFGIYNENCGIENIHLSFGHDEYLYKVLKFNNSHKLSEKYLNIIRFHSFYPWHSCGEYRFLMKKSDYKILEDVQYFNEFDLYSKEDSNFISDEIKNYYSDLLNKYFPKKLKW